MSGITNYQILRFINILLCGLSIGFEAYAYENSFARHQTVELIYLGFMGFFAAESILSLLIFARKPRIILEVIWRLLCSVGLIVISSFLIFEAIDLQNNAYGYGCKVLNGSGFTFLGQKKCQWYELKLAAGIISIVNGVIYTLITGFQSSKDKAPKEEALVYPGPGGSKIYMPSTPTPYSYPQPSQHHQYQPRPVVYRQPSPTPPPLPLPVPVEVIPVQQIVPRAHLLHQANSMGFNYQAGGYEFQREPSMSPVRAVAPGIQRQVSILSQKAAESGRIHRQGSKVSHSGGRPMSYRY